MSSSKQEHSEDELSAAMGMVLMRCQYKPETEFTPTKKSAKQKKQHKQRPLNPNITIQITHPMQNMRLEDVTEDECTPKNKCTTQIEQQKHSEISPKISINMTHPTQKVRLDTLKLAIIQIQNLSSKYSKAHLRTLCRNLLKKLLSENSF